MKIKRGDIESNSHPTVVPHYVTKDLFKIETIDSRYLEFLAKVKDNLPSDNQLTYSSVIASDIFGGDII